jgi:16S rRNA (adenine1518-N6/adenine1519-N6)-dimethyltransferase
MVSKVAEVKKIFRDRGLAPKKWLGQNLLIDGRYLRRIVDAANVAVDEPIVEVGAGLGMLTEALIGEGARVMALEVDSGFFEALRERFKNSPQVELIHADALKYDFRSLAEKLGKLRVVANLPYSVSSRLMFKFYEDRDLFGSLLILLQKEVAERLTADPGTKDYGVLTVLLGVSAQIRTFFDIPGRAFYPAPEVTSTLVSVTFPESPPIEVSDSRLFTRLVKTCFSARRKTLRNNLRAGLPPAILAETIAGAAEQANIDLGRRAETLSPVEFARFAEVIGRSATGWRPKK